MSTFACNETLEMVLNNDNIEMFVVFGVGGLIALTAIIGGTISTVFSTRSREATRRELAAYVAEGSITPDDAVAMMNAGEGKKCFSKGNVQA